MLRRNDGMLLVVDMQERLMPAIDGADRVVDRVGLLLKVATALRVPIMVSEQYPRGLGGTVQVVLDLAGDAPCLAKTSFSCAADPGIIAAVASAGRSSLILCGAEAHVCVLQTALGFRAAGLDVVVVADAVGSRRQTSKDLALRRMEQHGIEIVDTEMVAFEWLERAATDEFRAVAPLLR
jgi:nicotinamidase-related amidase